MTKYWPLSQFDNECGDAGMLHFCTTACSPLNYVLQVFWSFKSVFFFFVSCSSPLKIPPCQDHKKHTWVSFSIYAPQVSLETAPSIVADHLPSTCMPQTKTFSQALLGGTMNVSLLTHILTDKISLRKPGRRGFFHHDRDPKQQNAKSQEFLKKNKEK